MEDEKTFWYVEEFDETGQKVGRGILFDEDEYYEYIAEEKRDYPNFTFKVTTLKAVGVKIY